jgi:hypothetical protein
VSLASISGTTITSTGTYTPIGTTADSCLITINTNFGCADDIGYSNPNYAVVGYNAYGQLGADASGNLFCSAILMKRQ